MDKAKYSTNETENNIEDQGTDTNEMKEIPEITTEELQTAINRLKKGKSADSNGIRAEDIKACDDETKDMVRQIFNEIEFTPTAWRKVRIKVIHKKGDFEDVGSYRPICSLFALYKLFTAILYSRLYPRLDQIQAEDQAGFRCTYQEMDIWRCTQWLNKDATSGESKYVATVDVMKAFDSITHKSMWKAPQILRYRTWIHQPPEKLYKNQKSDMLEIKKKDQAGWSSVELALQHCSADGL